MGAYGRLARAQHAMLKAVFPDPNKVVVLGDNYRGHETRRGTTSGTNVCQGLRRFVAQHRRVVLVNEHRTSKTCSGCGHELAWKPNAPRHQECASCHKEVERDMNAAVNMHAIWKQHVVNGERPSWLQFRSRVAQVEAVPAPSVAQVATASGSGVSVAV